MKPGSLLLGVLLVACTGNENSVVSNPAAGTRSDSASTGNDTGAGASSGGLTSAERSATGGAGLRSSGAAGTQRSSTSSLSHFGAMPSVTSSSARTTGGTTGTTAARGSQTGGAAGSSNSDVLGALGRYLAAPRSEREPIDSQQFAREPLTREQAEQAAALLWADHVKFIEETRSAEHQARTISQGQLRLRYSFKTFGQKPVSGRSLYISLHGGGNADPSVNDEQWENQKTLYEPDEGIYLAPRAPTDTWNLWHESHIDPMFERLIANLIVLEAVDPNRVYVMGYSAGGDGVYQLGPRMADHWAAAAAMAGHPNDAKPYSLRNIGFTIHVGALDTAYDRNLVAEQWNDQLDALQAEDPSGYAHLVQVHEGKPHWMDLEDAVALPWMAKFTRNPVPDTVVWHQDDVPHTRFYWLAVDPDQALAGTDVRATCDRRRIVLETTGISKIYLRLSDDLVDLDSAVTIQANGRETAARTFQRQIAVLAKTLDERGDPRAMFSSEVEVTVSE